MEHKKLSKVQQIVGSVSLALNSLSRYHLIIFWLFAITSLIEVSWLPYIYYNSNNSLFIKNKDKLNVLLPNNITLFNQLPSISEKAILKDETEEGVTPEIVSYEYTVVNGDTLSNILSQCGIDMRDINQLVKADKDLRNLQIGQQISWMITDDNQLQHLKWEISRSEIRTYNRIGNIFKMTSKFKNGEWKNIVLTGVINGNFIASAHRAGLNNTEISSVIQALQWQVDFRRLRAGDKFSILLSREELNGKNEKSYLLYVYLQTDGKDYYAIRAKDGKFYDCNGVSLARDFIRFPTLKQYRVSSNFNLHRLNPVTGRISPHKGVDFAMPIGTPILVIGDGEVVQAKYSNDAGNCVVIRHGHKYMTRYMHMKKLLVKPGDKVKRGDCIGLSGSTGRSTGPHLHYEVWINNQAVNPLTTKLPRAERLTGKDRSVFLAYVREILPQLKLD